MRYAIGIDLGTTHCAMARVDLEDEQARTEVIHVPQLVAAGEVDSGKLLASFLYLPPEAEGAQPRSRSKIARSPNVGSTSVCSATSYPKSAIGDR